MNWSSKFVICVIIGLLFAVPVQSDDGLWILKTTTEVAQCDDATGACVPQIISRAHPIDRENSAQLFRLLDRLVSQLPSDSPPGGQAAVCTEFAEGSIPRFDAEARPVSEKIEALAGLQGVFVSATTLKGPSWYAGNFGEGIQRGIETRFRLAGIPLLTEEEAQTTPGRPKLNIYFSNTNLDTGCRYSVFASLTQTMLLTRNLDTKLEVGTWAASGGPNPTYPDYTEIDAIFSVIDRFVDDWRQANPPS